MPIFRPRSAERDRDNDQDRYRRLVDLCSTILSEIEAESTGLRRRYDEARDDASMVFQAIDAEGVPESVDTRLNELESAMLYCETRTKMLAEHSQRVAELRALATRHGALDG